MTIPESLCHVRNENFLVVGCGGGSDIFAGIPIGMKLEELGNQVIYANYSTSALDSFSGAEWVTPNLLEVSGKSQCSSPYRAVEIGLAEWFHVRKGRNTPIYCLKRAGTVPTLQSYQYLVERFQIDTVICIDGGTDGLCRGDEHDLGTPSMDSISILATCQCQARTKLYAATAFGIESPETDYSHAHILRRMGELAAAGAFVGVAAYLPQSPEVQALVDAFQFVFGPVPPVKRSIIISSILASMRGQYGRLAVTPKTEQTPPFISPLGALIWYYDAVAVAKAKLYFADILNMETVPEVGSAIERSRGRVTLMPKEEIRI